MTTGNVRGSGSSPTGGVRGAGHLFPASVVHVELFHDVPDDLFPEERQLVAQAVDKRLREFTTARSCAREALRRLGHPAVPIPRAPSGAPVWPAGVVGSITHCEGYRAAAVAGSADTAWLGLDAEPNLPLADRSILSLISLPGERRHLAELAAARAEVHWERLLFSAKESVYKVWSPMAGRRLDFGDAEVDFSPEDGTFRARATAPGAEGVRIFHGRWQLRDGILLTAVTVGRRPPVRRPAHG
ncbi:4'-phosphopantetheinyl transferase [Streptomyces sp. NPDC088258]|uniref:4'-phosphopantetheinyl transferase family protein n=1 Tax=Streptomyces sp. NPDC088258 TaxID=3365849 RepID=UPI003804F0FD